MADLVSTTLNRLKGRVSTIKECSIYNDTKKLLDPLPFDRIRCLALGSPTTEFQALYQLALLTLLAENYDIKDVSCYDPVFTPEDIKLLEKYKFAVDSEESKDASVVSRTLFYMPHAPRSITEKFINEVRPNWILGNDLTETAGSLTKAKFLEELPTLATIVHLAEGHGDPKSNDGFNVVKPRKRGKNSKLVYKEPELVYSLEKLYFSDVKISRISSPRNQLWKDSFSDMALNSFVRKEEKDEGGVEAEVNDTETKNDDNNEDKK